MTTAALVHGRVLLDGRFAEGMAVVVEGARISAVVALADVPAEAERLDLAGALTDARFKLDPRQSVHLGQHRASSPTLISVYGYAPIPMD